MKVLIGTTNPSKAEWLGELIGAGTELLTLGDVNISAEPSETGATPAENAAIKAEFYGKTFQPVVCHDSGLYFAELAFDDPRQPRAAWSVLRTEEQGFAMTRRCLHTMQLLYIPSAARQRRCI